MEIYDGDSFQEDEVSFETFYKIVSSRTEKHQELQNLVLSWIEEEMAMGSLGSWQILAKDNSIVLHSHGSSRK